MLEERRNVDMFAIHFCLEIVFCIQRQILVGVTFPWEDVLAFLFSVASRSVDS